MSTEVDYKSLYEEQRDIVAKVWKQLGSPSYDELKGRSIHDLISEALTKISQLEQQILALKLAGGLSCELHGCDSEGCTTQQYLKDAEEMLETLATQDRKIYELEQQILDIQGNAAIRFAEAEARWHRAETAINEAYALAHDGFPTSCEERLEEYFFQPEGQESAAEGGSK